MISTHFSSLGMGGCTDSTNSSILPFSSFAKYTLATCSFPYDSTILIVDSPYHAINDHCRFNSIRYSKRTLPVSFIFDISNKEYGFIFFFLNFQLVYHRWHCGIPSNGKEQVVCLMILNGSPLFE